MAFYNLPNDKTFLVAVKGFILNSKKEILLLQVSEDDISVRDRGKWNLPGGLVEFNEDLEEALRREIIEETGLVITPGKFIGLDEFFYQGFQFKNGKVKDARIIVVGYMCKYEPASVQLDDEHVAYEWVAISEIAKTKLAANSEGLVEQFLTMN